MVANRHRFAEIAGRVAGPVDSVQAEWIRGIPRDLGVEMYYRAAASWVSVALEGLCGRRRAATLLSGLMSFDHVHV